MFDYSIFSEAIISEDDPLTPIQKRSFDEILSIMKHGNYVKDPNFAKEILKIYQHPIYLVGICVNCHSGRVLEFEEIISEHMEASFWYAQKICQGKLPEVMHNKILAKYIISPKNEYIIKYFKYLEQLQTRESLHKLLKDK